MKHFILILMAGLFSIGTIAQSKEGGKAKKEFIEIAFLSNGDIIVDGKKTKQAALVPKLEALQKKKGEVHYYQAPKIKQIHLMKNISLVKLIKSYKVRMIAYADEKFSKRKGQ